MAESPSRCCTLVIVVAVPGAVLSKMQLQVCGLWLVVCVLNIGGPPFDVAVVATDATDAVAGC